jgi:hypothetical protein
VILGKRGLEGGKEKNLTIVQLYFSWKLLLRDDSLVKRVWVTSKRGGEYGIMLYFVCCNGKWLR